MWWICFFLNMTARNCKSSKFCQSFILLFIVLLDLIDKGLLCFVASIYCNEELLELIRCCVHTLISERSTVVWISQHHQISQVENKVTIYRWQFNTMKIFEHWLKYKKDRLLLRYRKLVDVWSRLILTFILVSQDLYSLYRYSFEEIDFLFVLFRWYIERPLCKFLFGVSTKTNEKYRHWKMAEPATECENIYRQKRKE